MKKKKLKKQVGSRRNEASTCPKECPEDEDENLIDASSGSFNNKKNVICGSDGNTYR